MLAWLESISDFIQTVVEFVVSIFQGFIRLIRYIGTAVDTLYQMSTYLPGDLVILAMAFVSVAVVYLLVGREG